MAPVAVVVDAVMAADVVMVAQVMMVGANTQNTATLAVSTCTVMAINAAAGVVHGMHRIMRHRMTQLQHSRTRTVDRNHYIIAG